MLPVSLVMGVGLIWKMIMSIDKSHFIIPQDYEGPGLIGLPLNSITHDISVPLPAPSLPPLYSPDPLIRKY